MKTAIALTLIGAAALAFGAWGRYSPAGRARFDEMAGIVPLVAFWLGALLLLVAAVLGALAMKGGNRP